MVTGFEDDMLRTNKAIATGLLELTKAIKIFAETNANLNETIKDLKAEIEISNGLKRNFG